MLLLSSGPESEEESGYGICRFSGAVRGMESFNILVSVWPSSAVDLTDTVVKPGVVRQLVFGKVVITIVLERPIFLQHSAPCIVAKFHSFKLAKLN